MISTKITYSLTEQDYINFEKIKLKINKTNLLIYVTVIGMMAIGVYMAVSAKMYETLIMTTIYCIVIILCGLYVSKIKPQKTVDKILKLDNSFLSAKEMTIDDNSIEIKTLPKEGESAIMCVYPFSSMSVIYETKDYFQFVLTGEANMLPKKAIPKEIIEAVEKTIRKNPNYILLKNI